MRIPFNIPYWGPDSISKLRAVIEQGPGTDHNECSRACEDWLEAHSGCRKALLTTSCTASLELSAILLDIKPGDEIIMPSFTFVSSANAFVLRGGVPVFVDIRADTLNIDETKIEEAITPRTKAILVVHYAGVACELKTIMAIAQHQGLYVVEDAAHAIGATYDKKPLGSFGQVGCYSFHRSKNLTCGEGGALLLNESSLIERAEIVREFGTNRAEFMRGQAFRYEWLDIGSSYILSELTAALLNAQLGQLDEVTAKRRAIWYHYDERLSDLEDAGMICRPKVPEGCHHNGHIYFVLFDAPALRERTARELRLRGIEATSHFAPLHLSPAGQRYGRACGPLKITESVVDRMLRLPLFECLSEANQDEVIENLDVIIRSQKKKRNPVLFQR